MTTAGNEKTPSKEVMDAILQVIEGGDPEEIARDLGMEPAHLLAMRDVFVEQSVREALLGEAAQRKIGRNEPCPCGSGRKYKKCCLAKHERARSLLRETRVEDLQQEEPRENIPDYIIRGFDLLAAGEHGEAIAYATKLLDTYPNDDRLHDTLASGHLALGNCDEAIEISRARWQIAREEKGFYLEHGLHQRWEPEQGAPPPHFYAPETWLEKYWIATTAKEYRGLVPDPEDPSLSRMVAGLLIANDLERFPEQQEKGLEQRREALQPALEQLKAAGPAAIPYLLQVVTKYSWATLFIPELLAHYGTDLAIRGLIDISMFGYHFVSEACLKHLEALGAQPLPHIRQAFSRDLEFHPLKVGLISMLSNVQAARVDELLLELLNHEEPTLVDWAGVALGRRRRVDLLETLEEARSRIGDKPRITWAIDHLKKLKKEQGAPREAEKP